MFIHLTYCFSHFLGPLHFVLLLLEVAGEYILQDVSDSGDREALVRCCGRDTNRVTPELLVRAGRVLM